MVRGMIAAALLVAALGQAEAQTSTQRCDLAIASYDMREESARAQRRALRLELLGPAARAGPGVLALEAAEYEVRHREAIMRLDNEIRRDLAPLRQEVRRSCAPGMTMQFHPDSSLIPELCDLGKIFARPRSSTVCVLRAR
jgi:hypothetical protein